MDWAYMTYIHEFKIIWMYYDDYDDNSDGFHAYKNWNMLIDYEWSI